jgi:hypothetical protein
LFAWRAAKSPSMASLPKTTRLLPLPPLLHPMEHKATEAEASYLVTLQWLATWPSLR